MIPKIIHYCWFGKRKIPEKLQVCMKTWQEQLPDYKIMRWDEDCFDVQSTVWTREAYAAKKYAFVSDYVRLLALEEYGGIYFDTDVLVKKSFDPLLCHYGFMGFENDLYLASAVMGFEPHYPVVKEFLEFYRDRTFITENGQLNNEANVIMMTEICKQHGLAIDNSEQEIAGVHIYPREFFCPLDFYHNDHTTKDTMAIHLFDASWLDEATKRMVLQERKTGHKALIRFKCVIKHILGRGESM